MTDRQARFLVTVMRHAGLFVGRQYAAFAGITHGQKVHDFIETLLVRRFATSIELGTTRSSTFMALPFNASRSDSCWMDACGRPLTGSWSKGCNGHYAYYHCQKQCRAVHVSKGVLEGAFADELALLQPSTGYMRLVKDRILFVWEQRRAEAKDRTVEQEKRVKLIQQKLDRLDDAFSLPAVIDGQSYERQRDRLCHTEAVDGLEVQGILAFAERILPRASDLWVQASLDYKQRLQ